MPTAAINYLQSVRQNDKDSCQSRFRWIQEIEVRKRRLATDTLVYPLAAKATNANESDAKCDIGLLESVLFWYISIQLIWADGAYRGQLADWLYLQYQLDITLNLKDTDFSVIAKRWIVE